jgi:sugar lactone lactonase YvrE
LAAGGVTVGQIGLDAIEATGRGLNRPECVLATKRGDLYMSDWRGGVMHLEPNGGQRLYAGPMPGGGALRPNGIALRVDGSFLVCHLGESDGGVYTLTRDGVVRPFLERVDGIDLPPTNFAFEDSEGRVWITVSTRRSPRALGYRADGGDGFVVLYDRRGARIVADGLGYANEIALHPDGGSLYVNETFARRMSRLALRADGSLAAAEPVAQFGTGTYPDGLCFDVEGGAWVTSIVSNRVLRIAPDGTATVVIEDADPAHVDEVETAYRAGTMSRTHLDAVRSSRLRNISSLAFGGTDLRTAWLGCLLGTELQRVRLPIAGHPLAHWHF